MLRYLSSLTIVLILSACSASALPPSPTAITSPETALPAYPSPLPSATPYPQPLPAPTLAPTVTSLPQAATATLLTLPALPPAAVPITITLPDGTPKRVWTYSCPQAGAAKQAKSYSYRVIQEFPHDPAAYTEGLVIDQGDFFESTGLYGSSSLRRVDLTTGKVLQQFDLPEQYFGEGIAVLGDVIYQLTWREQTGFIYDRDTFAQTGSFFFATEGWGMTNDDERLYMSDGSHTIYILDPNSLNLLGSLDVTSEFGPVEQINELELIDGEIWANIFQSACIIRIDPASGQVNGWIDLTGLYDPSEHPTSEMPNGIAYDGEKDKLYVTGKFWPTLFQIELVEK